MEYNQQTSYLTFVVKLSDAEEGETVADETSSSPCVVINYDCKLITSYDFQPFNRRRPLLTLAPDQRSSVELSERIDQATFEDSYNIITCNLLELEVGLQYRERIAKEIMRTGLAAMNSGCKMIVLRVEIVTVNQVICDERTLVLQRSMVESSIMAPASKASVDNLQIKKLKLSDEGSSDNITCGTCLDDFVEDETVSCLPCSHNFHPECIVKWLEISHVCPVCRYEFPTD